jgi:hypothetical protein
MTIPAIPIVAAIESDIASLPHQARFIGDPVFDVNC